MACWSWTTPRPSASWGRTAAARWRRMGWEGRRCWSGHRWPRDSARPCRRWPGRAACCVISWTPAVAAGRCALERNRRQGRALRQRLQERIAQLRADLARQGIACRGGEFPVQYIALPPDCEGAAIWRALSLAGVDVLLQGSGERQVLTLLLRADHSAQQVAYAARTIGQLMEVLHV